MSGDAVYNVLPNTINGHPPNLPAGTTINSNPIGGGVVDFTDLGDVPNSYSGQALKAVRVNAAANALEFYMPASGGSFLINETVRVDPIYGDDGTGVVGDLSKPFATTQGAIDAFELMDPLPSNPIIEIGGNAVGGFSTILPYLTVVGVNGMETTGTQRTASAITSNITMAATDGPEANTVVLILKNIWSNKSIAFNGLAPNAELDLVNSAIISGAISARLAIDGVFAIYGTSLGQAMSRVSSVSLQSEVGASIHLYDISVTSGIVSDGDGTDAYLTRTVVTDTGSVAATINNLYLSDSFVVGTNAAGATTYQNNVLFNPSKWDFSTLPTVYPSDSIHAWHNLVDNTVRLGPTPTPTPTATPTATASATATATPSSTATATPTATACAECLQWNGGSTNLVAATGRTSLGATTVGSNIFTLTNPSAITFLKIAADNSVTSESATTHRTSLGLAIGANVQAWDTDLDTWSGITPATGVGAFLATPSSANLASAVTDETGSGALVFGTSPTFVTPAIGTPASGDGRNMSAATDSVTGEMSAADHTTLTALSVTQASGSPPPFICSGCPVFAVKTGVDFKTNAVTDIFTVPATRTFVVDYAEIMPRSITGGAAIAIVWKIIESGASGAMTRADAATSSAPLTTKVWKQPASGSSTGGPYFMCAAGNKVQFSITTAWTTSTAVTGDVRVYGHYD